jgi:hypothetical protein
MTLSEIYSHAFRLVAQCLNELANILGNVITENWSFLKTMLNVLKRTGLRYMLLRTSFLQTCLEACHEIWFLPEMKLTKGFIRRHPESYLLGYNAV